MLRDCVCLVIAHMLDATQLCLSCHCTHAGCYATVFVLSLHTCWMLCNCVCLVIARMLDATQLCLSCHCTHAGCYATVFVLSLHACWMLRNCVCLVIAHILDATQLCLSCHCTHAGCYATVFVLSLHTCWMLRNCVCLVIALGKLAHKANNARRWWKTTFFFRRMVPIRTNSKQNAFVKTRTHGKNGTKWTYEPTDHKWKSTPLQHFVNLQQNDMWISPRVAITAVTLFLPPGGWAKFMSSLQVWWSKALVMAVVVSGQRFRSSKHFRFTWNLKSPDPWDDSWWSNLTMILYIYFYWHGVLFNWVSTNDELVKFESKYLLYDMSLYVVMCTTCVVECSW